MVDQNGATLVDVFSKIKDLAQEMTIEGEKQIVKHNSAAGARARKASQALSKLLVDYRKLSVKYK